MKCITYKSINNCRCFQSCVLRGFLDSQLRLAAAWPGQVVALYNSNNHTASLSPATATTHTNIFRNVQYKTGPVNWVFTQSRLKRDQRRTDQKKQQRDLIGPRGSAFSLSNEYKVGSMLLNIVAYKLVYINVKPISYLIPLKCRTLIRNATEKRSLLKTYFIKQKIHIQCFIEDIRTAYGGLLKACVGRRQCGCYAAHCLTCFKSTVGLGYFNTDNKEPRKCPVQTNTRGLHCGCSHCDSY